MCNSIEQTKEEIRNMFLQLQQLDSDIEYREIVKKYSTKASRYSPPSRVFKKTLVEEYGSFELNKLMSDVFDKAMRNFVIDKIDKEIPESCLHTVVAHNSTFLDYLSNIKNFKVKVRRILSGEALMVLHSPEFELILV